MTHPGETVSERAGWPMDRCAECGKPEHNGTDTHPPLCDECALLWYGPHEGDELESDE
jgi:hypothetical protein